MLKIIGILILFTSVAVAQPLEVYGVEVDKCVYRQVNDGTKVGFLSKTADSAHYNAWTVLFPHKVNKNKKYYNYVKSVNTVTADGKPFFSWTFKYLWSEDKSFRPVFRANHSTDKAPKNVVIKMLDDKGVLNCYKIPDPEKRYD